MNSSFNPVYKTIRCSAMTEEQMEACSKLFSENYGLYSGLDDVSKQGKHIKLPPSYYKKMGENPNMYVSLCYFNDTLLGHAFYLKTELANGKKCSWVTQMLVHHSYRKRKIATRLLQSAWGFSDYHAWGLATTNALTIKTLEAVTWRQVNPVVMYKHIDEIAQLCEEIVYANKDYIRIDSKKSQIFTDFYPEFQHLDNDWQDLYVRKLGKIEDGCEWLAFTFQHQPIEFDEKHWEQMLDFSEYQLEDAYSRMSMDVQSWTKYTPQEIDYIENKCRIDKTKKILDVGCGQGRHSIELAKRGYQHITAYDFSERLLKKAKEMSKGLKINFEQKDCRHLRAGQNFDAVICLYDVIGSFRSLDDNVCIIKSIYKSLKKGGRCVISVMNMELTQNIAIHKTDNIKKNPQALLQLKASRIMQSSGDVFNPDYFLLDTSSHLIYRKEQFEMDDELSSEYVIADYRFTRSEICDILEECGFRIILAEYVKVGAWETPLEVYNNKAKEILIVAEK